MAIIRYPRQFELDFFHPLRELEQMRRRMDRLFESFSGRQPFSAISSGVFPSLNLSEDESNLYVRAELPGVAPEDLNISIEGNTLSIRGQRKMEITENVSYHRRERQVGNFHKSVSLPYEVNTDAVSSELKNGILKVVLPKAEAAKPRKIEVKSQ